jgi:hypothetical protein
VLMEISAAAEDLLLQAGILAERDADDRLAVGHAVERLLQLPLLEQRHAPAPALQS